jgi:hypothetical protein
LSLSRESINKRLEEQTGRDFTLAVLDAFKYLGFEVEDIEETQGTQAHSDLIVKAPLATNPYFAVLECTAVREGSQVNYTKLYQLGSNFPRYLTKYSKDYPSAYKMLVGRPSFSADTIKLAHDTALLKAMNLLGLLFIHDKSYLSQDELQKVFQTKGEVVLEDVLEPYGQRVVQARICALVYMSLLQNPTDKSLKRKKEWTTLEGLVALVKHWGWMLQDYELPNAVISNIVSMLSSPIVRALHVSSEGVMLSSLPFERVIKNMGELGGHFQSALMTYIDKAAELKKSSQKQS